MYWIHFFGLLPVLSLGALFFTFYKGPSFLTSDCPRAFGAVEDTRAQVYMADPVLLSSGSVWKAAHGPKVTYAVTEVYALYFGNEELCLGEQRWGRFHGGDDI
jgi:hypothetical protein